MHFITLVNILNLQEIILTQEHPKSNINRVKMHKKKEILLKKKKIENFNEILREQRKNYLKYQHCL